MANEILFSWLRKYILLGVAAFAVAACGGSDAPGPDASDQPASSSSSDTEADSSGDSVSGSVVRKFAFEATGVDVAALPPGPQELTVTGGCVGTSPLSIGFHHGAPHEPGYFGFSMTSVASVAPGQLGDIELAKMTWDNGVTTPANMPPDSPIKVPNRYEGAGMLTLKSHSGIGMAGRMSGVATGEVSSSADDESASLVVEFDINLACAN